MALPATGYLTANNAGLVIPGVPSGRSSLPTTFAAFGTFGGGSLQLQAGFMDANNVMQWINVGAAVTATGAVNVAMRANQFRLVLTGATTPNLGWWFG